MTHAPVFTGAGWRCPRCNVAWDQGDPEPADCLPSEDGIGVQPLGPRPRNIVAFAGEKGSGKDTAADVLANERGFTRVRLADCLKEMLRTLLRYRGVPEEMVERYIEGDLKEVPCPALNNRTMRHAMQTLGTDWGRMMIDRDLWVDATHDRILQLDDVVVPDVRFHNEVQMIRDLGGQVVRIERKTGSTDTHASEVHIKSLPSDHVVSNRYHSAEGFQAKIRTLLPEAC